MPSLLSLHLGEIAFRQLLQGMKRFKAYSQAESEERIQNDANVKMRDFYSYLLQARDPETGRGFSGKELAREADLLIVAGTSFSTEVFLQEVQHELTVDACPPSHAGSDTVSTALAATIFYLVHNEDCLRRLQEEVRSGFEEAEAIRSGPRLQGCRYLRACIDEAMRCSPPIAGLMPREVLAGELEVDGHRFTRGVEIGVPQYALHHNQAYFFDPFTYRPSRWLAGSAPDVTPQTVARAQSAFAPFSIGPRACVGKGMAYLELSIVLARVVWLYDMRLAPGSHMGEGHPSSPDECRRRPEEYQLTDKLVAKGVGPLVQFRPRPLLTSAPDVAAPSTI